MFFSFVDALRKAGIPASLTEHLLLLEALEREVIAPEPEAFYYLARATFVHDEGMIDRFDAVFGHVFRGLVEPGDGRAEIPEDWLRKVAKSYLTAEQMAEMKAQMGDDFTDDMEDEMTGELGEVNKVGGAPGFGDVLFRA